VQWLPAWGGERMVQMIRERADWCISRQRKWGLPIPVFYCEDCGEVICDEKTIESVSAIFGEKGSNAWFDLEASELLPEGYVCPKCGKTHFVKEANTLDGWFDSGSTHFGVLKDEEWPADVYLEGADQYRGWFQSSLLTAVGSTGVAKAPFKAVLTHGWVVDGEGRAMHKSLGNGVDPLDMIKKYGADLVRLWVASADYQVDVRASDLIFKQLSEAYRKIRNTARILLANLGEGEGAFDPDADLVAYADMYEIDRWAIARFNELVKECRRGYDEYEFHAIYHAITNFCTTDMSKLYVDITKDRVYTEKKDSAARRSALSAMYIILNGLTRLLAPILSFTAEEIWKAMPHAAADNKESVFLNLMPAYDEALTFADVADRWNRMLDLRDDMMKALELARADKMIGKSLDAAITVYTEDEAIYELLAGFGRELATVTITSDAKVVKGAAPIDPAVFTETVSGIAVKVMPAEGKKCDRCWAFSTECVEDGEGCLCARCNAIVNA